MVASVIQDLERAANRRLERTVTAAAIGALRRTLTEMNLGLSQAQCVAVDEVASREISAAIAAALKSVQP